MPMLSQIINTQQPASAWSNFGAGLGQGVAGVSQMMVNQKLNDMLEQKQLARQHAEQYRQAEGFGNAIGRKDLIPHIAAMGVDNFKYLMDQQGLDTLSQNLASISGLGGGQTQETGTMASRMPQARQRMTETYDYAPEGQLSAAGQGIGQNQPFTVRMQRVPTIQQQEMLNAQQAQAANTQMMANNVAPNIKGIPESQKIQEREGQQVPIAQENRMPLPNVPVTPEGEPAARGVSDKEFMEMYNNTPPKLRPQLLKARQEQQKAEREERGLEFKEEENKRRSIEFAERQEEEPKQFLKNTLNMYQKTAKGQVGLKNIEELADKKGSTFVTRGKMILADAIGADREAFLSAPEEMIQKFSADQMPSMVSQYGGINKILKSEADSFQKTLPNLMQTNLGMKTVARYLYTQGEMTEALYEAARDLNTEYVKAGKRLPKDFEYQVGLRAEPKLQQLREKLHQIANPGAPTLQSMKDKIMMIAPNGSKGTIPTEQLTDALNEGYKMTW